MFGADYQYKVKKPFFILYAALLSLGLLLTLGRWYSVFQEGFVVINGEIHSHISNFSLSLIVYVGIGYAWLCYGRRLRTITALGVLLTAGNLVCETLMGFLNTTDLIDALYGAAGVLTAYIYLFFTKKYGLEERPPGGG